MNVFDGETLELRLLGGVVQRQTIHIPPTVVMKIRSYRQACRLAWKLRQPRNLRARTLAELTGLYASHVSEYFAIRADRRELPARHVGAVERVLGNTVISQWLALQSNLTVLEELQLARKAA